MRHYLTLGLFVVGLVLAVSALTATPSSKVFAETTGPENPCAVPVSIEEYGVKPFKNPPELKSHDGILTATLDIRYTERDTTKIGECRLKLRSYNGGIVGPTLKVEPGDVMKLTVTNDLPATKAPCVSNDGEKHAMDMLEPPDLYNITNLHTHGLHVSPGNNPDGSHQDNVFVTICPNSSASYEIHIPANHPAGTFWYHAHVHGSTALQVSSTMVGAIIVEGGLDNVPQIKAAKDQIFVLQQISYGPDGMIEDASTMYDNWENTGSRTMVNGQLVPLVVMRPGEIQRWRMIHAGVDQSLYMKTTGGPLHEIATDGNALGRIDTWHSTIELEPGYRSDVLFKAPKNPGRYYLRSGAISAQHSLLYLTSADAQTKSDVEPTPENNIVAIDVKGELHDMPLPTPDELRSLAPYKPITPKELTGAEQDVTFAVEPVICGSTGPCERCTESPDKPDCKEEYMVDWYVYPNGPTRTLKLGTASRWTLAIADTSEGQAHPFHIHVNPFEMVRLGPNGRDETVWKDTLMVREGEALKYRTVLSRYEDYAGAFVLHCHILPHEDKGMMQDVEIVK